MATQVKDELMASDENYRRLAQEHTQYAQRLESLVVLPLLPVQLAVALHHPAHVAGPVGTQGDFGLAYLFLVQQVLDLAHRPGQFFPIEK